uniref:Putative RNA-directed DNA polymerase n=1 Tax=Tanacetum cinerariifolium TaxID=118510 RepID=A0A6L2JQP9_TANCI|nr:putative RNA-directed DNA polymerase [Tanacetum cinerariifolium]
MSTQRDIYAAGSKNRPPMLNKDSYVPWYSRLLRYAKSKPNKKLLVNSIKNGSYVRRMIHEPGDPNSVPPVAESTYEHTDDELTEKEAKKMEDDDQAIQTIIMGLPKDNYAAVDSCKTAQEIWLGVQQMMKGSEIGAQEKKDKLFNEWERFKSADGESIESYYNRFSKLMNDFKRNKHFPKKIASNLNNHRHRVLRMTKLMSITQTDHTSNVISVESSVQHSGGTVEQHPATVEETRTYFESLYNNLVIEVEKVNMVNGKIVSNTISKPFSIPNDEFSNDAPIVARKFLYEDEIAPIVNQVDARVQNFKNHFVKEAAKFVRDFKSLAKEADDSLDKIMVLEKENDLLFRAVVIPKVVETIALSKPVTSNSAPSTKESEIMKNDKLIATGMFRINPLKTSRVENFVPNKPVKASVRTNPITTSQPHVITKKDVNSNLHSLSSTVIDNTAKTRRPRLRSNIKKDRVTPASKSSCIKNKEVGNDKSKVDCAMCKQCLITTNHDVYVLNYMNGMNSCNNNQSENVSNSTNHKKHMPKVKKPNKSGSKESLASHRPSKPRTCLRWSPTGRIIIVEKNLQSNGFQIPLLFLAGYLNLFMMRTIRFGNDHVAAILGYGDLQWGNILIAKVYYVEDLGHNLLSVGQFCELDLENGVVERRNQTLVEAARIMLIFYALLFLWAEAIATACYTQNRSIIHRRFDKTPYELINDRKPDISFLHVFGALCYPKKDREDIGKLGAKGDIGFFIGYFANSCVYRVYNRRTKKIIETVNVTINELLAMDFKQRSSKLGLQSMTSGQIISLRTTHAALTPQVLQILTASTTTANTTPTPTHSTPQAADISNTSQDVDEVQQQHVQQQDSQAQLQLEAVAENVPVAMVDGNTFVNPCFTIHKFC